MAGCHPKMPAPKRRPGRHALDHTPPLAVNLPARRYRITHHISCPSARWLHSTQSVRSSPEPQAAAPQFARFRDQSLRLNLKIWPFIDQIADFFQKVLIGSKLKSTPRCEIYQLSSCVWISSRVCKSSRFLGPNSATSLASLAQNCVGVMPVPGKASVSMNAAS